jgi:GDPmannose 4,6-dehydratase
MYPSFFQASSSEMFSVENNMPLNEISSYGPRNAYSRAKYEVFLSVNNLKREYDWNIKSGIMFNHESEFRDKGYLFTKIIDAAISIIKNRKRLILEAFHISEIGLLLEMLQKLLP